MGSAVTSPSLNMKVLGLLLSLSLASLTSAQCDDKLPSGKDCGPQDFITEADPKACSYYYDCVQGCVTRKQCGPHASDGLPQVFDDVFGWCEYTDYVDCGSRPCNDPEMCKHQPTRTSTSTTPDCGHIANCTALGEGFHADPYNCRKYWQCFKDGTGKHFLCEDDPNTGRPEMFDLVYMGCNYEEYTDCGVRPKCDECDNNCEDTPTTPAPCPNPNPPLDCSNKPDGYYSDPYNCRKYWSCSAHKAAIHWCPDDPATGLPEVFDLKYMGCNYQAYTDCGDRPICDNCDDNCHTPTPDGPDCGPDDHHPPTICQGKPDGWYPDRFNCIKYWHCSGGHGIHYLCNDGLHYEAHKVQCDYPERVNCEGRPICDHCDANCHN